MTTPTADFSFSTRPMIDINPSTTTGTQLSNTLTTHVSEITSYNTMPTGPSEVIATSISTFTAMQISVYTVPYSSSDSNYPPDSSLLSTGTSTLAPSSLDSTSTTFLPQAASSTSLSPTNSNPLPPSKTTNMKLIACGTTGGIAFILIFAILFWFLRRRQKRNNNSRDEPTDTWLPWTRRVKEIPRTTLSSYPFKEMASPTSTSSGEVANETWNASLRDYRNIRMMDIMRHGMNNTQPRNQVPARVSGYESNYSRPVISQIPHDESLDAPSQSRALAHMSGYESHYSRPFESQIFHDEDTTSLGQGQDRNSFGQRMVQKAWDGIDLQNGYVARPDGEEGFIPIALERR